MLRQLFAFLLLVQLRGLDCQQTPEEEQGVRYANRCEACKILAAELEARLGETGKSHDVIEIGYSVDDVRPKKRTEYRRSELRLLESLENVCERVLEYNLHKERTDSTRFAKGMSQTFQTLHGLVDKGVKVDLGIPYELWDKPPVEVTQMKNQCENMLEEYEDAISNWYFQLQQDKSLQQHLCEDHVLKRPEERKCLKEQLTQQPERKKQKKSTKGDKQEL
ncbi:protein canopy homolog 4 [Drosophila virilis]|uniref:DUF3456 domain-containing protein n=1 Tax=Drosophila virilis TaxID=7244 RepID=B4LD26_DROVI|nr:protein canopy homolog 4 [Drosophila virilis]EDW69907.1 uncharacterized protein Dvir_GJ13511 [Drosophila virilis]